MSDTPSPGLGLWLQRLLEAIFLGGQVMLHLLSGKIHRRNTLDQMSAVGPESLVIALVTAGFVGAVFTIQVAREFINFGATTAVGGVFSPSIKPVNLHPYSPLLCWQGELVQLLPQKLAQCASLSKLMPYICSKLIRLIT